MNENIKHREREREREREIILWHIWFRCKYTYMHVYVHVVYWKAYTRILIPHIGRNVYIFKENTILYIHIIEREREGERQREIDRGGAWPKAVARKKLRNSIVPLHLATQNMYQRSTVPFVICTNFFWLMVTTHLKHIRQIGSFSQGSGWKSQKSLKPPPSYSLFFGIHMDSRFHLHRRLLRFCWPLAALF